MMKLKYNFFKKQIFLSLVGVISSILIYGLNVCFLTDCNYSVFQNVTNLLSNNDRALAKINNNQKIPSLWNDVSILTNQEFYQYSLLFKMNNKSFKYSFNENEWFDVSSSELTQNKETTIRNHQCLDFSSSLTTDSFVSDSIFYSLNFGVNDIEKMKIVIENSESNILDVEHTKSIFLKNSKTLNIGNYDFVPDAFNIQDSKQFCFLNNSGFNIKDISFYFKVKGSKEWTKFIGEPNEISSHAKFNNHIAIPNSIYKQMAGFYGFNPTNLDYGIGNSISIKNCNDNSVKKYIVYDVYDESIKSSNFGILNNFFYTTFGDVVFFEKGFNSFENFDLYILQGNDFKKNKSIYTEIRPYLSELKCSISYPDYQINYKENISSFLSCYVGHYRDVLSNKWLLVVGIALIFTLVLLFFLSIILASSILATNNETGTGAFTTITFLPYILFYLLALFFLNLVFNKPKLFGVTYFVSPIFGLTFGIIFIILFIIISLLVYKGDKIMKELLTKAKTFSDLKHDTDISNTFSKDEELSIDSEVIFDGSFACFFGMFSGPTNSAGACRSLYIADLFNKCGIKACLYCSLKVKDESIYKYQNQIYYSNLKSLANDTVINKIFRPFFLRREIKRKLNGFKHKPKYIIIYSVLPIMCVVFLKKYCNKYRIKLIYDVVEFQMISQQKFSSFFNYYTPELFINKYLITKNSNIIVISKYLENYFAKRGCKNISYIPFIVNNDRISSIPRNSKFLDKIVFLYAGSPNRGRDLLVNNIKGFNMLPKNVRNRIIFIVAGISAENFIKHEKISIKEFEKSLDYTYYVGRLSHSYLLTLYALSDFSVLIKPDNKRLSEAGFPTKISESLSYGVPVVCNLSSDLDLYLTDGIDSFLIKSDTPDDFAETVERIASLDIGTIREMRKSAKNTCKNKLDSATFFDDFKKLI